MQLNVIQKNNETILPICFYGKNRNNEVLLYHKKVTDFFNIPMNYIEFPFEQTGHGQAIQWMINQTINSPQIDYYWFCDMDCTPTDKNFINIMYDKISDKRTIFGPALSTNHRGFPQHIYCAAFCLAFSRKLYLELGSPNMTDMIERSDTGQELTWIAQEKGKNIFLMFPRTFNELTQEEMDATGNPKYWELGKIFRYGLGTQYDYIYHSFMQNIPRSSKLFIEKCKQIIYNEYHPILDGLTVCVDYSDFLEEVIVFNKKHFNKYVVITSNKDIKTQNICKKENVGCFITDSFYENNNPFNKGLAISLAIKKYQFKDWLLIHDGDICLPFDLKENLNFEKMDIEKMYGCSRKFIPTYNEWKKCLSDKNNFNKYKRFEGYGCGFFQLFNMNSSIIKNCKDEYIYPPYPTAEFTDIAFLYRWCPPPDPKPEKLDMDCYHLTVGHGTAHSGRYNSKIEEFKKPFKEQANFYNHSFYDSWKKIENI